MALPYKVGSSGAEVTAWQQWFGRYAKSYSPPLDGYFGNADADATRILQSRLGVPVTGQFDAVTAAKVGYKVNGTVPPAPAHRPIWIYTAPGSGAPWNVGPSFDLGERCRNVLHINHQPVGYPIGGYLGLMGGDPTYSYNDVIGFEGAELERLIAACPDLDDPHLELWFSGYSQSADGMEDALARLFGDSGRFKHLRDRINGVVQFGNPSTMGTGIARKVRPAWLDKLIRNINYDNDFYAVAPDEIRPAFYAIIIEADTELPFFVHVLKVAMGVILNTVPIFGGLLGPLAAPLLAGMTGLNGMLPLLTGLMGTANSTADEAVDKKLTDMLSATGLIKNIPGLVQLVGALPGLQAHGGYAFDPVMMQRAYDIIAGFRR
jgi:hypothetical protein